MYYKGGSNWSWLEKKGLADETTEARRKHSSVLPIPFRVNLKLGKEAGLAKI